MTTAPTTTDAVGALTATDARRLLRLNVAVGLAHLAQAVLILLLAKPASSPVGVSYLTGPPGSGDYGGPASLFDLRIDLAVAAFLLLAAIDHLAVASPWARRWYASNVARGINPARWWEYAISASLMVVLIAMLAGITEATALLALFGVNAAMILFGLAMERANLGREQVDWRPFAYGCLAGAVPWIAIALQIVVSQDNTASVPGFVIAIFITLFLLFNTFAVNMWLQYRGRGRWAALAHAEPDPEPRRQERARLAGLRRRPGRQLTGNRIRSQSTERAGRPRGPRVPRRSAAQARPTSIVARISRSGWPAPQRRCVLAVWQIGHERSAVASNSDHLMQFAACQLSPIPARTGVLAVRPRVGGVFPSSGRPRATRCLGRLCRALPDDLVDLLALQPPFATVAEEVRVGIGGRPYAAERIDTSDDLFE